eukprot:m.242404 g.242404  ORF g.242404 m.242404 type:complete len:221 (+) comp15831_c0_seq28:6150-6812(+)
MTRSGCSSTLSTLGEPESSSQICRMSKPTRLRWPTPADQKGWWARLRGAAVLRSGAGHTYVFEGDFFHGYPVYVWNDRERPGRRHRVLRKGSQWFYERKYGYGDDAVLVATHVNGGDPRLPPSGEGWVSSRDRVTGTTFTVCESFKLRLKPTLGWSLATHRDFPRQGRWWIINLILCNQRVADCRADGRGATGAPPPLPLEMWLAILGLLVDGDLVPEIA